ncbi:THA11-like protein [Mya arenaria]|uniref:THA11-like protein n=1 Tax=Mya arenaria TaxID=6604 RepID=A0ABY7G8K3_MYAAR|nr:THA11-like protein [Mya arenaria]
MGKKDFCCAEGCSHERSRGATCSFFRIPEEPKLRTLWLNKISRVEQIEQNGKIVTMLWTPSKSSKLCSCHFDEPPQAKSMKKWFQIPSIFSHRPASSKPTRKAPKERQASNQNAVQLAGHDYLNTEEDKESFKLLESNKDLVGVIQERERLQTCEYDLKKLKASGQVLEVNELRNNDKLFRYCTGLKVEVFDSLYKYLEPKAKVLKYPQGERTKTYKNHAENYKRKPGKARQTSLEQEIFFTLVKLKLGLQTMDCSMRFGMSTARCSVIFTAWVTLLSQELEKNMQDATTTECDNMYNAKCFNEFKNLRVIVDCTELYSETPSSVGAHKQFHSNYKHHSTVMFVVGMNTGGAITYISVMHGGRSSDKFITVGADDLLSSLNPGEKVMADRGFTIQDCLPSGVKLYKKISEARVHIERAIRRIKQFNILRQDVKLSQVDVFDHIFKACGYLVYFQDPFLKVEDE